MLVKPEDSLALAWAKVDLIEAFALHRDAINAMTDEDYRAFKEARAQRFADAKR